MRKKPTLQESLSFLKSYSQIPEIFELLEEYAELKKDNEFLAARLIVEVVDYYYHIADAEGLAHGKKTKQYT